MDVSATYSVTVPPAETTATTATAASAPTPASGKQQPVAGPLSQRSALHLDSASVEVNACFADPPPEELVPASTFHSDAEVCSLDDPQVLTPASPANEEMHRLKLPEPFSRDIATDVLEAYEKSHPLPQAYEEVHSILSHASPKAKAAGGD
jgi:hypothetical protein